MNDESTRAVGGSASRATGTFAPPDLPGPEPSVYGSEAPTAVPSPRFNPDLASPFAIPPGTLLVNTYRVERQLGGGGMGEVYLTRHAKLGTLHAVKVIRPAMMANRQVMDLFYREARVLRGVRHDAVVSYEGFVQDHEGRDYLVMEYADGPSLAQRLRQGPLPVDEVLILRDRLAAGLAEAHRQGAIHRDLAPDNVILPGGQVAAAKLIDFGLSKLAGPGKDSIIGSSFAGKHLFASPEQFGMFGGAVDERSDIYSLGLVLAAAAVGRPLAMGTTSEAAVNTRKAVPDLSQVPSPLRPWLTAMLQPDPQRRPASLGDLLRRWPSGVPMVAPVGQGAVAGKPGSGGRVQRRTWVIIGVVPVLAVAVGFSGRFFQPKNPQDADDGAYQTALAATSEAGYHAYLGNCAANGCGHRVEAQERLKDLVATREARERAERERLVRVTAQREAQAHAEQERLALVAAQQQAEQERQAVAERQAADIKAFDTARKADSEDGYRLYLGACTANGCGHEGDALQRLTDLVTAREARERVERERMAQAAAEQRAAAERKDTDESAFKAAQKTHSEAAYRTYLNTCASNGCGRQVEAEQSLNALVAGREARERAGREQIAQAAMAAQALAERHDADARAYKTAQQANSEQAYQTYLDGCAPNGCGHRAEAEQASAAVRATGQKKLELQLAAAQVLLDKRNITAALRALNDAKTWDRDGAVAAFRRQRTVNLHAAARVLLERGRADKAKLVLDDMKQWDPQAPEVAELRERLAKHH